MDLRKRRSQEKLQGALAHHLQRKTIDAITIGELTRTAGVSRQTFYSNFSSKQSILLTRIEALFDRSGEHFESIAQQEGITREMVVKSALRHLLQECAKEKHLMRVAFTGQAGIQCLSMLKSFLTNLVSDRILHQFELGFNIKELDIASDFYAGALIGTIQGWLLDDTGKKDIDSVVEMFSQLISHGINEFEV